MTLNLGCSSSYTFIFKRHTFSALPARLLSRMTQDNSTPANIVKDIPFYTPTTLLEVIRARLQPTKNTVQVKGVYERNERSKLYAGYYYDRLHEETSQQRLSLKVPALLREELETDGTYIMQGSVACEPNNSNDGKIDITLTVVEFQAVTERRPEVIKRDLDIAALLRKKAALPSKDVDALLRKKLYEGEKPAITLIFSEHGVAQDDVNTALGEYADYYDLEERRITLSSPQHLLTALSEVETEIVAIFRGGGDLTSLNNPLVANALLEADYAVITALGHEADETLLDKVADRVLSTPTALGTYLKTLVRETKELETRVKQNVQDDLQKTFEEKLLEATGRLEREQKSRRLWFSVSIVAAVLMGLIFGLMLSGLL
jgi:exodeoxyribonuclease VII large subunit